MSDAPATLGGARDVRAATMFLAATVGLVVAADQLTKTWAVNRLTPGRSVKLGLGVELVHARNTGVAFSKGSGVAGIIFPIVIVIGIISWTARNEFRQPGGPHRWSPLAYGLILGGAFGNVIDRLFRGVGWGKGAVVDMVDLGFWPVFNVADAALSIGVILTIANLLFNRKTLVRPINSSQSVNSSPSVDSSQSVNPSRSSSGTEESS